MAVQEYQLNEELAASLGEFLREDQLSVAAADLETNAVDQGPVTDYHEPVAVIWAENVADVQGVVRAAAAHNVPLVTRGAGTGVSGGAHATAGSVILNLTRMNTILEVNAADEIARVEPGVINADLNTAVGELGLMFAPDPASYKISTIGGNIATNAGGLRCAKYGVTRLLVVRRDLDSRVSVMPPFERHFSRE